MSSNIIHMLCQNPTSCIDYSGCVLCQEWGPKNWGQEAKSSRSRSNKLPPSACHQASMESSDTMEQPRVESPVTVVSPVANHRKHLAHDGEELRVVCARHFRFGSKKEASGACRGCGKSVEIESEPADNKSVGTFELKAGMANLFDPCCLSMAQFETARRNYSDCPSSRAASPAPAIFVVFDETRMNRQLCLRWLTHAWHAGLGNNCSILHRLRDQRFSMRPG